MSKELEMENLLKRVADKFKKKKPQAKDPSQYKGYFDKKKNSTITTNTADNPFDMEESEENLDEKSLEEEGDGGGGEGASTGQGGGGSYGSEASVTYDGDDATFWAGKQTGKRKKMKTGGLTSMGGNKYLGEIIDNFEEQQVSNFFEELGYGELFEQVRGEVLQEKQKQQEFNILLENLFEANKRQKVPVGWHIERINRLVNELQERFTIILQGNEDIDFFQPIIEEHLQQLVYIASRIEQDDTGKWLEEDWKAEPISGAADEGPTWEKNLAGMTKMLDNMVTALKSLEKDKPGASGIDIQVFGALNKARNAIRQGDIGVGIQALAAVLKSNVPKKVMNMLYPVYANLQDLQGEVDVSKVSRATDVSGDEDEEVTVPGGME